MYVDWKFAIILGDALERWVMIHVEETADYGVKYAYLNFECARAVAMYQDSTPRGRRP